MRTLFIADLHLSDHTPDLTALFVHFLRDHAGKARALYILGDLFEAWAGDDDNSATARVIAKEIQQFSQKTPVYFIAGNRDFLIGKRYATLANLTLLPENHIITLHGKHVLLTHGDEMCTDDVAYLRYRKIIRNPLISWILLKLPFRKRKQIAEQLRKQSRRSQNQNSRLADVTETGVQAAFARHRALDMIVHGHTHRPNIHQHHAINKTITRYVLPDWHDGTGGYLAIDEQGCQFFRLPRSTR